MLWPGAPPAASSPVVARLAVNVLAVPSSGTTEVLMLSVGDCPPVLLSPVPAVRLRMPVLVSVTVPLVPPPLNPVPAVTPVIVPVAAVAQFHAVPLYCRIWLVEHGFNPMVLVLPRLIAPGVVSPPAVLAFRVMLEFCSMALVTPAEGMLSVTVPLVPPPLSPEPAVTPVMVPLPVPGNFCPLANVICPLLATETPVSVGVAPLAPNNRFSFPDGVLVLLPAGSVCQRNSSFCAALAVLLNDEAARSNGFELKPAEAVASLTGANTCGIAVPRGED